MLLSPNTGLQRFRCLSKTRVRKNMFWIIKKNKKACFGLIFGIFFLLTSFLSPQPAQACTIWAEAGCPVLQTALDQAFDQLKGALIGAAKNAINQIMSAQIMVSIGGGSGQPAFISDWRATLYVNPQQMAQTAMTDYFTSATGGRSSSLNYRSTNQASNDWQIIPGKTTKTAGLNPANGPSVAGTSTTNGINGLNQSFVTAKSDGVLNTDSALNISGLKTNAQKIVEGCASNVSDIANYTSANPLTQLGALTDSCVPNTSMGLAIYGVSTYNHTINLNMLIESTKAMAYQGYNGKTDGSGNIQTPGISIKGIVDGIVDLPNKLASNSQNIAESVAVGAVNMASSIVNRLITQGISHATTYVNGQIGKVTGGISSATGGMVNVGVTSGGGSNYVNQNQIPSNSNQWKK